MKYLIILICSAFWGSIVNAQTQNDRAQECPKGYVPVLNFQLSDFHFHKQSTCCETGFSFCYKKVTAVVVCKEMAEALNSKVSPVLFGILRPTEIELHFSKSIHQYAKYTQADLEQFSLESLTAIVTEKGISYWLPAGNYKVETTEQAYIVRIPYKPS
jgi:hypothetical protein